MLTCRTGRGEAEGNRESQLSRATSASDFADQEEDLEFRRGRLVGFLMAVP